MHLFSLLKCLTPSMRVRKVQMINIIETIYSMFSITDLSKTDKFNDHILSYNQWSSKRCLFFITMH